MKLRHGFVSNSSSSSFILFLDRKPESVTELKELLFHGEQFFANERFSGNRQLDSVRGWAIEEVAEYLFFRLAHATSINETEIKRIISSGRVVGVPYIRLSYVEDSPEVSEEEEQKAWNERRRMETEAGLKLLGDRHKGKYVVALEFADDGESDIEASLRHGCPFRKIDFMEVALQ